MSAATTPATREATVGTTTATRRRPPRKLPEWLSVLPWQILVILIALALWQTAVWLELYKPVVLSSPEKMWTALTTLLSNGEIVSNLWVTIQASLVALVLSVVVGVPIGLMLALMPRTERVMSPFLNGLNASPRIAFAPVFIIIFGLTESAKIALALSIGVFLLIANSRAGVHNADHDVLTLMRAMGASKTAVFFKVLLPAATPSIFAGIRLGLIYCMLGVVASELIAAKAGIGQLIAQYSAAFRLSEVYALILVLIVVAAVLNAGTETLERRLMRWRPPVGTGREGN